jgi:GTPase SAR1 family protein
MRYVSMGDLVPTYVMFTRRRFDTDSTEGQVYTYKNMKLGLIDIAGQSSHRQSWSQYFQATSGVILVVDSTDKARMDLVRQELHKMMSDDVSRAAYIAA